MEDALTKLLATSSSVHVFEGWEVSSLHPQRPYACTYTHARARGGWWPDGNGMQKAREGEVGGGGVVLPLKKKKSPRQICLVKEPGTAAAGNSVAPFGCQLHIYSRLSISHRLNRFFFALCLSR